MGLDTHSGPWQATQHIFVSFYQSQYWYSVPQTIEKRHSFSRWSDWQPQLFHGNMNNLQRHQYASRRQDTYYSWLFKSSSEIFQILEYVKWRHIMHFLYEMVNEWCAGRKCRRMQLMVRSGYMTSTTLLLCFVVSLHFVHGSQLYHSQVSPSASFLNHPLQLDSPWVYYHKLNFNNGSQTCSYTQDLKLKPPGNKQNVSLATMTHHSVPCITELVQVHDCLD